MQEKKNILTYEGLRKYEEELHELKVVKRQEVAQKIKEAREQGDLSENAEYDAAKDEQRDIEARIEELEKILKNAEVVVEDEVDLDKINIGCKVKLLDIEYSEELEYKIVGSSSLLKDRIAPNTFSDVPSINRYFSGVAPFPSFTKALSSSGITIPRSPSITAKISLSARSIL